MYLTAHLGHITMDQVVYATLKNGAVGIFREVEAIVGQFEPALGGVGLDEPSHHLEQVQQISAVFGIVDGIGLGKAVPAGTEHAGLVHFAVIREKESAVCKGAVFQDKAPRFRIFVIPRLQRPFVVLVRKHLEGMLFDGLPAWKGIPAAIGAFQYQLQQLSGRGYNTLVTGTDVCLTGAVEDQVIRRELPRLYEYFKHFVALLIFSGSQRPVRNRIQVGVDLLADEVGIALRVGKAGHNTVVVNAVVECATFGVGISADALQPVADFLPLQFLLEVVLRTFGYEFVSKNLHGLVSYRLQI